MILIRILLLTLFLACSIYFILVDTRWLRSIYFIIFTLLSLLELYWYLDRTNRNIASFLTTLRQNDFTTSFSTKGHNPSLRRLHTALNEINTKFNELTASREARHLYLEALIAQVSVGIMSYDPEEKIILINQAFRELTGKQSLATLNGLDQVDLHLTGLIREMKPGEERLVGITVNDELRQLSINKTVFFELDKKYTLISMQNIRRALNTQEVMAWKKIMRVLTHEIMNSVSPVTSLSDTLCRMLEQPEYDQEAIRRGLEAIRDRSSGLETFTRDFRRLTGIPNPQKQVFKIDEMVNRVLILLQNETGQTTLSTHGKPETEMFADPDLMGQVLINLVRNALDALEDQSGGKIQVRWQSLENGLLLYVTDNGPGIPADKLEQIFVPFFTTRKNGSGIGLAVSQQIVQLHDGIMDVSSVPGETTFRITLSDQNG